MAEEEEAVCNNSDLTEREASLAESYAHLLLMKATPTFCANESHAHLPLMEHILPHQCYSLFPSFLMTPTMIGLIFKVKIIFAALCTTRNSERGQNYGKKVTEIHHDSSSFPQVIMH